MRKSIGSMLLVVSLTGSGVGCAGQFRVYDTPRQDYHRWNREEDRYYRVYLSERRMPFIEFRRLNSRDQEDYWAWRHSRGDQRFDNRNRRDRDRDRDDRERDRDRR
jgi:hypothetical protein